MRFALLVLSLSFMACGGGGTTEKDLSMAVVDMTAPTGDMTGQTCFQLVSCGEGCAGSVSCENACAAKGTTTAIAQYNALFSCAYAACLTANDAGAPACTSNTDSSAGCSACVDSAAENDCSSQLATCLGSNA